MITGRDAQETSESPVENFTGHARVQRLSLPTPPAHMQGAYVTFEPVVWTPPGVKHWHGATPTTAMTHMALVEQLDGKSATWMEKVTDTQYNRAP
ncbi:MAG TPA: hypothetical protein VF516_36245 [Kofleriaceae bacterium]